jgi:hypothetical protein
LRRSRPRGPCYPPAWWFRARPACHTIAHARAVMRRAILTVSRTARRIHSKWGLNGIVVCLKIPAATVFCTTTQIGK